MRCLLEKTYVIMKERKKQQLQNRKTKTKTIPAGVFHGRVSPRGPAGRVACAVEYSSCLSVISAFVFGITEPGRLS